ncbi:hypothetical protein [Dyadobacter fermentans]|uniref:Uncharacterized protein n=1 Tax=Dyadobacter fermentans (strain ATCC 700827 / DSM 18053 / CIP 107007 / KCTC 52180 / NS114) TaxID=471854 RepID=C6VT94_DYAFD|nr:hypothetical protein [Dyadobacter fermentans]ACT96458.1 hypothetical protein Dfer_5264 [Dyadobacter fermentans DSM 18053]
MKLTSTITWLLLQFCALAALAQSEKSSQKLVKITQTIDSDVVYSDLDRISVTFTVYYTNQPDKEKKETNYVITYKCPAPDALLDTASINLDAPINFLTLKTELNQKIQVKGDSVRPIQGNTIMKLFVAFTSVGQLDGKRLPAGNLLVHDYIGTYKKDIFKHHEERQAFVSSQTSKVMVLNIGIDSLTKEMGVLADTISKYAKFIKIEDEKILNSRTLVEDNNKKIDELKAKKSELERRLADQNGNISKNDALLKNSREKRDSVIKLEKAKSLNVSDTQNTINVAETNKLKLEKYVVILDKLIKSNVFKLDSVSGTYKIDADVLKKNLLQGDSIILTSLIKDGYLKEDNQKIIELATTDLTSKIKEDKSKIDRYNSELVSFRAKLDKQRDSVLVSRIELAKVEEEYSGFKRLVDIQVDERAKTETELDKIKKDISEAETVGRKLADIPGLQRVRDEKVNLNKALMSKSDSLGKTLTAFRREVKEENKKLIAAGIFQIFKLHVQIERGYIERVQVFIPDATGNLAIYENIYAIGFSSVKNFMRFSRTRLYARLSPDKFVYLSDVFANYENFLENYTRDYCPADTTINDFKPSDGFMSLQRDTFKNLFDTKVYTDFEGIDPGKPNGLIQFEVSRRFNIKTSRIQVRNSRSDIGWLTYFNAFGSLNKIEKDKRVLELRNEDVVRNNQVISPYYATALDIRRYQNFALGGELNLFLFDWPDGKMTSYLDIGATYGHTPLVQRPLNVADPSARRDSISLSGHSSTVYPKISVELLSEKRIGFVLSFQFNRTVLFSNNNFKPITSYAKSDLTSRVIEPSARNSHMVECYIRAMPTSNRDGQFFFRARYFIQQRDRNTFFAQFQFGYSYNIKLKGFDS